MRTYIVRQPILDVDENQEVLGYEILYREETESKNEQKSDVSAANAIENFLTDVNSENFLDGKKAFITFTPNLLLRNIPKMFSPKNLIIQIDDDIIIHPEAQKKVYEYREKGYSVAINGFEFALRYFSILDVVDIMKVDFSNSNNSLDNIVNIGKNFNKEIIAYNINDELSYNRAKKLNCRYMQGTYVAEKLPTKLHKVNHMQGNFMQLMLAATKDEPNIDEIEQIISRDVTLTYSLLKLVNSAYFALRHQAKSVKQALMVLGLGQLKQWIYLLSFKKEDGSLPSELIKISFLRANLCSELSKSVEGIEISPSEAYLVGMFSTLGILMDTSLEDAINEVQICDNIKGALLNYEGKCGTLYKLVISYEKANWDIVKKCSEELKISMNTVTQRYFECVEYVNNIWNELTSNNPLI